MKKSLKDASLASLGLVFQLTPTFRISFTSTFNVIFADKGSVNEIQMFSNYKVRSQCLTLPMALIKLISQIS